MIPDFLYRHLFPLIIWAHGERSSPLVNQLNSSQWQSYDAIANFQLAQLQSIFRSAYTDIPYYRCVLNQHGLTPADLVSLDDLRKFPLLDKSTFKDNYDAMLSLKRPRRYERRHTSGTSGLALEFIKDRHSTAWMRALDYRALLWHDVQPGSVQARFWSSASSFYASLAQQLRDLILNRYRYSVMQISDLAFLKYHAHMMRMKPVYVYGYASAIYEFAQYHVRCRLERIPSVKVVICTSEMLFTHQRRAIEQAFGCPCINEYGCTEFGIIAFECPFGSMHLMDDNIYVEIIVGDRLAKPEETGDIVVTELRNYSMPFLRYRLGDIGSIASEPCGCGRGLRVLRSVDGRWNSFFQTTDGRKCYDNIFDFLASSPNIRLFKVLWLPPDSLLIQIEPETIPPNEVCLRDYESKIRMYTGSSIAIRFQIVDHLDRESSGKRNYFLRIDSPEPFSSSR